MHARYRTYICIGTIQDRYTKLWSLQSAKIGRNASSLQMQVNDGTLSTSWPWVTAEHLSVVMIGVMITLCSNNLSKDCSLYWWSFSTVCSCRVLRTLAHDKILTQPSLPQTLTMRFHSHTHSSEDWQEYRNLNLWLPVHLSPSTNWDYKWISMILVFLLFHRGNM